MSGEQHANGRRPGWLKVPTREELLGSRLMRPFAAKLTSPLIWRFNRRGVARGVALGLFAGFAIPVAQTPFAALMAVGVRANLPVAAAATFVTNPFTVPFIYYFAYLVGKALLRIKAEAMPVAGPDADLLEQALNWFVTLAGPTYVGLLLFAGTASAIGYLSVHWGWALWVRNRRNRRRMARCGAREVRI